MLSRWRPQQLCRILSFTFVFSMACRAREGVYASQHDGMADPRCSICSPQLFPLPSALPSSFNRPIRSVSIVSAASWYASLSWNVVVGEMCGNSEESKRELGGIGRYKELGDCYNMAELLIRYVKKVLKVCVNVADLANRITKLGTLRYSRNNHGSHTNLTAKNLLSRRYKHYTKHTLSISISSPSPLPPNPSLLSQNVEIRPKAPYSSRFISFTISTKPCGGRSAKISFTPPWQPDSPNGLA